MNKKLLKTFSAIALSIAITMSSWPQAYAGEIEGETCSSDVETKNVQSINISTETQEELSQEDTSFYQDISENIQETSAENPSIAVENGDDEITIYSVDNAKSDDNNVVLKAQTYSNEENASTSLESYSEIVIPQSTSDEQGSVDEVNNSGPEETAEGIKDANKDELLNQTNESEVEKKEETKKNGETEKEKVGNENEPSAVDENVISQDQENASAIIQEKAKVSPTVKAAKSDEPSPKSNSPEKTASAESENVAESPYTNEKTVTITAEELLARVKSNDQMSITFAKNLGFGSNESEIINNLQIIVDEYKANKDSFVEPKFEIHNVEIGIDKETEEVNLEKNNDGTYDIISSNGSENGYRTTITVETQASVTIVYDEKGTAEIQRKVTSNKPTDFVITLDISGSMESDGRDSAMFSALQTLLDEILAEKDNTVSIVLFGSKGAVLQLDVGQDGIIQKFSESEGHTSKLLFNSELSDSNGNVHATTLGEATILQLERLYRTSSGTSPDQGLEQAMELLEALNVNGDRNIGVILFTDGAANSLTSEYNTVELEKQIAEKYNATIVNVSIGDENQVEIYERYLDPDSDSYYRNNDKTLQENVLYYNIPKLTDKELAQKVTEMFKVAFEDITTEKRKLQTETITDVVLSAYGSKLIETIPAGFDVVQLKDSNKVYTYKIIGKDSEGNTIIEFDLGDILSNRSKTVSYCVIPTSRSNDIGVTAYKEKSETVLYTEPIDKLIEGDNREVKIIYTSDNVEKEIVSIPGKEENQNADSSEESTEKKVAEDSKKLELYYKKLLEAIDKKENPLDDDYIYAMVYTHLAEGNLQYNDELSRSERDIVLETLMNAPAQYRDLYLLSLFNYNISINEDGGKALYRTGDNTVHIGKDIVPNHFTDTFFHESGHAIQETLWGDGDTLRQLPNFESEYNVGDSVIVDVEDKIRETAEKISLTPSLSDVEKQQLIDAFTNNERDIFFCDIKIWQITPASLEGDKRLSDAYKKIREKIENDIKNIPYSNASMVQDLFGGVTNNKILWIMGSGHVEKNYWFNNNGARNTNLIAEAWAEFFAAQIRSDTENINNNAQYFPKATKSLEKLAEDLYNYYYDYYNALYRLEKRSS